MELTCVQYKFAIFQISASDISSTIVACFFAHGRTSYIITVNTQFPRQYLILCANKSGSKWNQLQSVRDIL